MWVCYRKDHIIHTMGSVKDAARNLDVCEVQYLSEFLENRTKAFKMHINGKMILF